MPCSDSVAQKISQNVGEGHDPPGRTQKHFALRFGEFGPNSLRICPSFCIYSVIGKPLEMIVLHRTNCRGRIYPARNLMGQSRTQNHRMLRIRMGAQMQPVRTAGPDISGPYSWCYAKQSIPASFFKRLNRYEFF